MRVRRAILAPVILTIGALGAGPFLTLAAAAPTAAAPAAVPSPQFTYYHG